LVARNKIYFLIFLGSFATSITSNASLRQAETADGNELMFVFHQPKYAPGDTAYFSAYLFTKSHELSASKQIVSLKLMRPDKAIVIHKRISFTNGIGTGQIILPDTITTGMYMLIAYPEEINFSGELLNFYRSEFIVSAKNRSTAQAEKIGTTSLRSGELVMSLNKKDFGNRDEVQLKISLKEGSNPTIFSIAVINENLFKDKNGAVNNLLSAKLANNTFPNSDSKTINSSYYFKGKAIFKTSGLPVSDSTRITFYLNGNDLAYSIYTRAGQFVFPLFRDFEDDEIFYVIGNGDKKFEDAIIVLDNPALDLNFSEYPNDKAPDAYVSYIFEKRKLLESYQYFAGKGRNDPNKSSFKDFLDNDGEIVLDKYESFTSMGEVLLNIVPSVKFRKTGESGSVRIFLERIATFPLHDPLYIIDGLMTDNTHYFLSLNPADVKRIGVLRNKATLARFGDLGTNGILAVETTIPDHASKIKRTSRSFKVSGISKPGSFNVRQYSSERKITRTPDLRPVLYWNPKLLLEKSKEESISFFTSDDVGTFVIQIFGVSDNKIPFTQTLRFRVTAH
jgi:hypothetical protein